LKILAFRLCALVAAGIGQALTHTSPWLSLAAFAAGGILFAVAERSNAYEGSNQASGCTPTGEPSSFPLSKGGYREISPQETPRTFWILLAIGVVLCAGAGFAVYANTAPRFTHPVWFLGLAFLIAAAVRLSWARRPWRLPATKTIAAALLLLGVSAGMLGWNLTSMPPEVHGDEAEVGNDAIRLLEQEQLDLFQVDWFKLPVFHAVPTAIGLKIFGADLLGLRATSAVLGTLSVLLLFVAARRLWGFEVALLSSLILISARFFIHLSRAGYHYIDTPFLSLLVVCLFVRCWRDLSLSAAVWCGIAIGLGVQTYYASRLVPILLALTVVLWLLGSDRQLWRRRTVAFNVIVLSAVATASPIIGYFWRRGNDLWMRVQETSIFSADAFEHAAHGYGTRDLATILGIQLQRALTLFNATGDTSLQYGYREPLFDPISAALFVLGIAAFCARPLRRANQLVVIWILLPVVIGAALTIDTPFFPRVSGTVPFAALAVGLALHHFLEGIRGAIPGRVGRRIAALCGGAFISAIFASNIYTYFFEYAPRHRHSPAVEISRWIREHGAGKVTYMVGGAPRFSIKHGAISFLTHGHATLDIRDLDQHLGTAKLDPQRSLFIVMPWGEDQIPRLEEAVGPLHVEPRYNTRSQLIFFAAVPQAQLAGGQVPVSAPAEDSRPPPQRAFALILLLSSVVALIAMSALVVALRRSARAPRSAALALPRIQGRWTRQIVGAQEVLFGPNEREQRFQPSARWTAVLLILITAGGLILRTYSLGDLPAGFFCDEAGLGYNSYLLADSGRDETNQFLPLYVWSFRVSYKNPVFIYSSIPLISTLGLNELAVRLTSALYGTATIVALFFAGRALMGSWAGLLAALFIAVCPWHLHFSRIAFELITFPFFFVAGLACLTRYTRGRKSLPAAMILLGFCLYTYAIAKLFVFLFLIAFALLHHRVLLRRWRESLLAFVVLVLAVAPVIIFDLSNPQRAGAYFRATTIIRPDRSPVEIAGQLVSNYQAFLSPGFLFRQGDYIARHAVQRHGELYTFFAPLLIIGALSAVFRRDRAPLLVLAWLLLYPIGPSLMTEIPSASRGIIGAPAFCMLAALGGGALLRLVPQLTSRRALAWFLQIMLLTAGGFFLAPQVHHYWRIYTTDYPQYSAKYYYGFQFGHREVVRYFLDHRDEYDQMILSTTDNNQPQSFLLFYSAFPPDLYHSGGEAELTRTLKMRVGSPEDLLLYRRFPRLLFAVVEEELALFSDYEVKQRVLAPDGTAAFVIASVRAPKPFVHVWKMIGPYTSTVVPSMPPTDDSADAAAPDGGESRWRLFSRSHASVKLRDFFPERPDLACGWALNYAHSEREREAQIYAGFDDHGEVWLNGQRVPMQQKGRGRDWPIDAEVGTVTLRAGKNQIAVKTCNIRDDWLFYFRLAAPNGAQLNDIRWEYD
jgi:4-amino-4-deoxy-L-arabinose transferase-like glycosyltransferase